jgi:hypothetical protein
VGVGPGVGGSFGDAVGASVGAGAGPGSSDVGAGAGPARGVPRRVAHVRRHHNRGGLGTAVSADCTGTGQPQQNYVPPPPSRMLNWQPLTTTKLRWIATTNNINGCAGQTGITQSRTIGVAFEAWVLKTMGQLPRWTKSIPSTARKAANNGLPASVIPEFVGNQTGETFTIPTMVSTTVYYPQSVFFEVKAVTGALTPGTSQWQVLGLLDAVTTFPPVVPSKPLPTAVYFTTTGNTTVSPGVLTTATGWGVAVWQRKVLYDANSANPNDPNLALDDEVCLNPGVYTGWMKYWITVGPFPSNPLTWATVQDQAAAVAPGDPDPAEVD